MTFNNYSNIDIKNLKQVTPMPRLCEKLGINLKNNSGRVPWRKDNNPSFSIFQTPNGDWLWKDHATGEVGDEIDLLVKERGYTKGDAIRELMGFAGMNQPVTSVPIVEWIPNEKKADPVPYDWEPLVEAVTEDKINELAKLRGYTVEFVQWLKAKKLLGIYEGSFAFAVHDPQEPVRAIHYKSDRGWRYVGEDTSVAPLFIGDENQSTWYVFESQWDMFAYADATCFHNYEDKEGEPCSLLCTRGASNAKQAARVIPQTVKEIVLATQNDEAGAKWENALMALFPKATFKRIQVPSDLKDLNEWLQRDGDKIASLIGNPIVIERPSPLISFISFISYPLVEKNLVLHGVMGRIIDKISPHTEACEVALIIQFLTGFGNLIGKSPYFQTDGARHYANLFAVLVGKSSKARKGTSWGVVSDILRPIDPEWYQYRIKSGLSSGEALTWSVRDSSGEGKSLDLGISDKRLLVQESEFAQILQKMKGQESVLSAVIRAAWDGGNLSTTAKKNPAYATNPHISIVGHITEEELSFLMKGSEYSNGFANRFLWVCVNRSKYLPHGGSWDMSLISEEMEELKRIVSACRRITRMTRSEEANKLWESIYAELSEERTGIYGSVTSRGEAQVLRLSILYALLDQSSVIEVDHLKAAMALWGYCDQSACYLFKGSFENRLSRKIYEELLKTPSGLSQAEISSGIFQGNKKAHEITEALDELIKKGCIEPCKHSTNGRDLTMYQIIHSLN